MTQQLHIIRNPLSLKVETHLFEQNLADAVFNNVGHWSSAHRLYRDCVSLDTDITPRTPEQVGALESVTGEEFFVVVYPADPVTTIIVGVAIALTAAAAFLLRPDLPDFSTSSSPNNELSARSNRARPNERIPDIFGKVRAIPDLISLPHKEFVANEEVELAFMCIGRGEYAISEVKDGDTLLSDISGTSAEIYGPNKSPNSGDSPDITIGSAIGEEVMKVVKAEEVNGQVLLPPNSDGVTGKNNIYFEDPNKIRLIAGTGIDFTDHFANGDDPIWITESDFVGTLDVTAIDRTDSVRFTEAGEIEFETVDPTTYYSNGDPLTISNAGFAALQESATITDSANKKFNLAGQIILQTGSWTDFVVGDVVTITNAQYDDTITFVDLDGVYIVAAISGGTMTLQDPGTLNSDWALIDDFSGDETGHIAATVEAVHLSEVLFVDLSGSYTITTVAATKITLTSPASVNAHWDLLGLYTDNRTTYYNPRLQLIPGTVALDLDALTYEVDVVTAEQITLVSPATDNVNWSQLASLVDNKSPVGSYLLFRPNQAKWIGPFTLDIADLEQVWVNVVAPGGLYKNDGKQQRSVSVEVQLELTPVDAGGTPTGPPETFNSTLVGSSKNTKQKAITIKATPTFTGKCEVRMNRVTSHDNVFEGTVADEVQWRDLYGVSPLGVNDFGNVTTVQTRTYATTGALAVKKRQLNLLATRKVPIRISGDTFGAAAATQSADEIISFICTDGFLGNRPSSEVDYDSVYNTVAAIVAYFGDTTAGEFNYTFDDSDVTFEDMMAIVGRVIFSIPYREGNLIKLSFERTAVNSVLLFNHRNKLPGTEVRAFRFGNENDHDGIRMRYIDPDNSYEFSTLTLPPGSTPFKPKELQYHGVTGYAQAYWHAWREWNKVRWGNMGVEFNATQEAAILVTRDRVLVADNTRPETQDGEIIAVNGLILDVSQPITFEPGQEHTIFLQLSNGSVEAIAVSGGPDAYKVVLASAPSQALRTDIQNFARTTFIIVQDQSPPVSSFLVSEKFSNDNFTYTVRATNYDPLFYLQDQLAFWAGFFSISPVENSVDQRVFALTGSATINNDVSRAKNVFEGTGTGDGLTSSGVQSNTDYTKCAWVNLDTAGGSILVNGNEEFELNATTILAGHNTTQISYAWTPSGWHHVALTHQESDNAMVLYVDGVRVDGATSASIVSKTDLTIVGDFDGKVDDIRIYDRVLTLEEILKIYRTS